MKVLSSLILFLTGLNAFAVGFSQGNDFTYSEIQGDIYVSCPTSYPNNMGPSSAWERCRGYEVAPGMSDYFVGPANIAADTLKLVATSESGKVTSKDVDYDSAKGMSSKKINLAIKTLTQKPLLKLGANKVQYTLLKDGNTVASGEVTVNYIDSGKTFQCQQKSYFGNFASDCQNPSVLCSRYFDEASCH